jgi:hypothetical protein
MKPETFERVKAHGFRVLSQVNLPSGRYQLHVAVANRKGKSGSVVYDLEVPEFTAAPMTMSGVAITAASSVEAPTITPKDPLAGFLPGPATTAREFARGEMVALFAEFYENQRDQPEHMVDMLVQLRADDGRVVREMADERSSRELEGASGGYGFGVRIPLDVDPGLYVLHVEGRSRAGSRPSAGRDILIRIR